MWHPHLSRDWIDEINFKIVDSKRKFEENFPIFLEMKNNIREKNEDKYITNNKLINPNNKMKCSCSFIKENNKIILDGIKENKRIRSITKKNERGPVKNFVEIKNSSQKNFLRNKTIEDKDKGEENKNKDNQFTIEEKIKSVYKKRDVDNKLISKENEKIDLPNTDKVSNNVEIRESNKVIDYNDPKKAYKVPYKKDTDSRVISQEEEIQKKYMSILNDIRKVDQIIPGNKSQKRNPNSKFLNSNLLNKLNLLDINKNKIHDTILKKGSNLSDFANLNSLASNSINNILLGNNVIPFQPLDINNYRLKEMNSQIIYPNNNVKRNLSDLSDRKNINYSSQKIVNSRLNHNEYFNPNQRDISNFQAFPNKSLSNQNQEINYKIKKIQNSDNNFSNDFIYKNILDYLAYNSEMMNNIQKLLLANTADRERNFDNPFGSHSSQILHDKETKLSEENNEDFYLLNNLLNKNKNSDMYILNPLFNKQIISRDPSKINDVISNTNTPQINIGYDQIDSLKNLNNPITNKEDIGFLRRITNGNKNIFNIYNDEYNNKNNKSFDGLSNNFSLPSMNSNTMGNENHDNLNVEFLKNLIIGN